MLSPPGGEFLSFAKPAAKEEKVLPPEPLKRKIPDLFSKVTEALKVPPLPPFGLNRFLTLIVFPHRNSDLNNG